MSRRMWLVIILLGCAIGRLADYLADMDPWPRQRNEVRVIRYDSTPPPAPVSVVWVDGITVFAAGAPGPGAAEERAQ